MAARLLFALALLAACGHGPNYQAIPIGSPCKHDSDCGTQPYICLLKSGDVEYPNGYCTEPCSQQVSTGTGTDTMGCPVDSACIVDQCRRTCTDSSECREAEGYTCTDGTALGLAAAQFCDYQRAPQ